MVSTMYVCMYIYIYIFKHAIICYIMIKYAGLQSIMDVKCYSRMNFNVTQYNVVLLQHI